MNSVNGNNAGSASIVVLSMRELEDFKKSIIQSIKEENNRLIDLIQNDESYTVKDIEEKYSVTRQTIEKARKEGRLKCEKISGKYFYKRSEIEKAGYRKRLSPDK